MSNQWTEETIPDKRSKRVRQRDEELQGDFGFGLQRDLFGDDHKHTADKPTAQPKRDGFLNL